MLLEQITPEYCMKAVSSLKQYVDSVKEMKRFAIESGAEEPERKVSLMDMETDDDKYLQLAGFNRNEKVNLYITLKRIPPNTTPFTKSIVLPKPFNDALDARICIFVKDLSKIREISDREYDLQRTREFYKNKLLKAGCDKDFINSRVYIMTLREFITEHSTTTDRKRLARAYDVFIAQDFLLENKHAALQRNLGMGFFVECKKMPFKLCFHKPNLKQQLDQILSTVQLYITGRGVHSVIPFGILSQETEDLSKNLMHTVKKLEKIMGSNIQILRIGTKESLHIPILVDLRRVSAKAVASFMRPEKIWKREVIEDDFDLVRNSRVRVHPTGRIEIIKNRKPGGTKKDTKEIKKEERGEKQDTKIMKEEQDTKIIKKEQDTKIIKEEQDTKPKKSEKKKFKSETKVVKKKAKVGKKSKEPVGEAKTRSNRSETLMLLEEKKKLMFPFLDEKIGRKLIQKGLTRHPYGQKSSKRSKNAEPGKVSQHKKRKVADSSDN